MSASPKNDQFAELAVKAGDLCVNLQPFFNLAEIELEKHNNSDFDNIAFLIKAAKAEVFRFSGLLVKLEEGGAA